MNGERMRDRPKTEEGPAGTNVALTVTRVRSCGRDAGERHRQQAHAHAGPGVRVAKHGALLFGLYLTPKYANKLVQEARVEPQRFREYYTNHLPQMCRDHLNGKARFDSMQAFVEEARVRYIII